MNLTEVGVIISLIGTASGIILQFRKEKSDATKVQAESIASLTETALKLNKQEVDTLRLMYEDLYTKYKDQAKELAETRQQVRMLEDKLAHINPGSIGI